MLVKKLKILLSVNLPRNALLTIIKSFIRPHLEYGDILHDKSMIIFRTKWKKFNTCLAITGEIQGTSRERPYDELGLHSLVKRVVAIN